MRRLIILTAAAAAMALAGCTPGAPAPATSSVQTAVAAPASGATKSAAPATSAPASAAADLTGTWKQNNSNSPDAWQEAVIKDGVIEVFWVSNKGDTRSLFWSGSYTAPSGTTPFTWTSKGDVEKMKSSMLASQDATKDFTFDSNSLSWKASMAGTTTTVRASKVN